MVSYTPQQRRSWLEHFHANGQNVSATCREFGISRPTLYRWLERYDPERPRRQLKRHTSKTRNRRKPTWSVHHLAVLAEAMMEHPDWGRKKCWVYLVGKGFQVSPATVGRMIQSVRRRCPICKVRNGGHNIWGHLSYRDLAQKGLELPLAKPPSIPSRKRSKASESAVTMAEELVKKDPE